MASTHRARSIGLSVLGVAAFCCASASATTPQADVQASKPSPPPQQMPPPSLSDTIEALGSSQFADTYGGESVDPTSGLVSVYVTAAGMSSFGNALASQVGSPSTAGYQLIQVARSYSELESLTMKIAGSSPPAGVHLVKWGPDLQSNTVKVQVTNYSASAAAALKAQFGADEISVVPLAGGMPRRTLDRFDDVNPFWAGDALWFNNQKPSNGKAVCTNSFGFTGKASGRQFGLTAGHCFGGPGSSGSVQTNFSTTEQMGSTSTNYFQYGGYDFASIYGSGVGYQGVVYKNGGNFNYVTASTTVADGDLLTADGANGGEVQKTAVVETGICINFPDGQTCHLDESETTTGQAICVPGDSGGPMYQYYNSSNDVKAAGIIVGGDTTDSYCDYHRITDVLSKTNGALITS